MNCKFQCSAQQLPEDNQSMTRVLVLNSSYLPTGTIGWKKGIKLLFQNKADILETSHYKIHTVNTHYTIPAVIRLKNYNNVPFVNYKYCRKNVYKRDKYRCRYCNKFLKNSNEITIDHMVPKSKGGTDSWENTVTSCMKCNHKKKNRTPEEAGMTLLPGRLKPTYFTALANINDTWTKYLPIKA